MRSWLARSVAALWLLPAILCAGEPPVSYSKLCVTCGILGADSIGSVSGQFVVHGSTLPLPRFLQQSTPGQGDYLELIPQTVAITAERVKRALVDEFEIPNLFQQKVHVVLLPRAPPEQPVTIVSHLYRDQVVFQIGMPVRMDHTRFVKALVQVLLSDFSSRGSRRVPELPTWLVEGVTQHLFARIAPTLVANKRPVTYEIAGYDRLHVAREVLSTNACLTFHELSFPKRPMTGEESRIYQASAHLFLSELLTLPEGRRLLPSFIARLRGSLNWQTAFYQVYGGQFQTALDVEKWWALSWFHFKTGQGGPVWPLALSLQKLNSVLLTTMQMRHDAESLPERRDVALQKLVSHDDFNLVKAALTEKLSQMYFLQFNMPEPSRKILAQYHEAIQGYLERRGALAVQSSFSGTPDQRMGALISSTIHTLDELDQKRESLRLMAAFE